MSRQLYLARTSDDSLFETSRKDNSEADIHIKQNKLKKFKEPNSLNEVGKQEIDKLRVSTLSVSTTV